MNKKNSTISNSNNGKILCKTNKKTLDNGKNNGTKRHKNCQKNNNNRKRKILFLTKKINNFYAKFSKKTKNKMKN